MDYQDRRKLIAQDWHRFFVLEEDDTSEVNDLVKQSWKRSREYKIKVSDQYILEDDIKYRKKSIEDNYLLIDIARPYMGDLYKVINNTDFMITLLDKDGFVLDVVVHPNLVEMTEFNLLNLSEKRVGTNAMGTCLYLDKPVQTYGEEHCYQALQNFTTSAAPIHGKNGQIIGCIGITGFADDVSVHTLGMAIAVSYAIENKIVLSEEKSVNLRPTDKLHTSSKNGLYSFEDIIGDSDSIRETINIAKVASRGNSNILILGESGTGKELFAQSIHNNSPRKNKPFIDVNCGALPLSLAESELFGYEGGSYTGSRKDGQAGKFELADGGTIFLDEIGELPLSIQVALLRVIQERKVRRIGGTSSKDIDIKIIAATNKNLFESVQNNTFRGDLFYRLNVFNISLPPLREHREDIPKLVERFIKKYNEIFNIDVEGITEEALSGLMDYNWPGNIRELENIVERAVQIAMDKKIELKDLPFYIRNSFNNMEATGTSGTMESQEYKTIIKTLRRAKGNAKLASEILGISRATIYRRLRKYDLDIDDFRKLQN